MDLAGGASIYIYMYTLETSCTRSGQVGSLLLSSDRRGKQLDFWGQRIEQRRTMIKGERKQLKTPGTRFAVGLQRIGTVFGDVRSFQNQGHLLWTQSSRIRQNRTPN